MFLTDLGLRENEADDYAEFMGIAIDPLFRAGVATVILDNTGYSNTDRTRGTSAKVDLNEVLFTLKTVKEFGESQQGQLQLKLKPGDSRFGNEGEWVMDIGGGAFSSWRPADQPTRDNPEWLRAALAVLPDDGTAISQRRLLTGIRDAGVPFGNEEGKALLWHYADGPGAPLFIEPPQGTGHSLKVMKRPQEAS
jgi:hypothetical protein